ncbi:hypothetical protein GTQ99_19785, partial [Kineococcus sp. T13]
MRSRTAPAPTGVSRRTLLSGAVGAGVVGAALAHAPQGAAASALSGALQVAGSTRAFALAEHPLERAGATDAAAPATGLRSLRSAADLAVVTVEVGGGHMVGVTFPAGTSADTVGVRVRRDGGDWGAWSELALHDSEPDPGTSEARGAVTGSDPLWLGELGASATVQVRLPRADVAGAQLQLVDAGTSSALSALAAAALTASPAAVGGGELGEGDLAAVGADLPGRRGDGGVGRGG